MCGTIIVLGIILWPFILLKDRIDTRKQAKEKERIKNETEKILEKYRYLENEKIIWTSKADDCLTVFYRKYGKDYQVKIKCNCESEIKNNIFEYFDKLVKKYYTTVATKALMEKDKLTWEDRCFSDRKLVDDYCTYIIESKSRSLESKLNDFFNIISKKAKDASFKKYGIYQVDNNYFNNQTEKMFIDMVSKADSDIADIFTRIKDDYNNYMNQK